MDSKEQDKIKQRLAPLRDKISKYENKTTKKESTMPEGKMIKITGLWKNEDRNGNTYFSGYLGSAKVLIFKNKYKETDKQPDYNMFVAPKKEESGGNGGGGKGDDFE